MYKMCLGRILKSKFLNLQPTQFLIYYKYLLPIKLTTKCYIHVFHIQFSVALKTLNPKKLMFKSLPKSKYPTGMLYFLTEHTLIIYVHYKKGSKRKASYLLEKNVRERFSTFRFRQHF